MIIDLLIQRYTKTGVPSGGGKKRAVQALFGKSAQQSSSRVIIDLGAGTGTVIFVAAKKTDDLKITPTKFIAVEINPLLLLILHLRRIFHPNRNNIKIVRADIFSVDYNKIISRTSQNIIYLYVGTPALTRLKPKLEKLPTGTHILSYMYKVPGWEEKKLIVSKGLHNLYEYIL